jgi:hypothetical protein
MLDDARAFGPADPKRVYRNYVETCGHFDVEPVPRNRAQDLAAEWSDEITAGRQRHTRLQ